MLMPLIERSEGRSMAMIYQDALVEHFLPLLTNVVSAAVENNIVYPQVKGMEEMVLHLVNRCWMCAAAEISSALREGRRVEPGMLLMLLERYRRAVEVLLDAPYGSMEFLRVEELSAVCDVIRG